MKKFCGNCAFCFDTDLDADGIEAYYIGTCRRFPPADNRQDISFFPVVIREEYYCGEWKEYTQINEPRNQLPKKKENEL